MTTKILSPDWQKLAVATRQQLVRDFYNTGDHTLADTFLSFVRAPKGYGVFASNGPNYQHAVFGRDSIEVAEDLLASQPALAKEIILFLAHLQGRQLDLDNEEEPGKIHHEYRSRQFSGITVSKAAVTVFDRLFKKWGGNNKELRYYGSHDATALFIRLVASYYNLHDASLLNHSVTSYDGTRTTVHEVVRRAAQWLAGHVAASDWHLFEYKRLNPVGIYNQSWEDSDLAYIHLDGRVANADDGLAAAEIQGYAYDALTAAADIAAVNEDEADSWRRLAARVQAQSLKLLWMDDAHYFAMGLDHNPATGETRQIKTINSNPALLLASDILVGIPEAKRQHYLETMGYMLFSEDFLTPVGLRLRAKKHLDLVRIADYHGCQVSWPKQTFDIAKGLRHHGLHHLAMLLEDCVLHAVAEAGEFYEFFFVDIDGRVKYHYRNQHPNEPTFHDVGAANLPEPGQAWTISAVLSIIASRQKNDVLPEPTQLERSILQLPNVVQIIARHKQ